MTKGSVALTRLAIGSVAVGTLAIVVGNSQIAMGRNSPLGYSPLGYTVRYVGLGICTMTAIGFLFVRIEARHRARAHRLQPTTSLPLGLTSTMGPSQMLITWIRVFCVFLFVLAIFNLFTSSWPLLNMLFGRYPFRGMPTGYVLYMLSYRVFLLVPGFLIWSMTNAILRMSALLDEVSGKVVELQQRINQMMQTRDPINSSK